MTLEDWCKSIGGDPAVVLQAIKVLGMKPGDIAAFAQRHGDGWLNEILRKIEARRSEYDEFLERRSRCIGPKSFSELAGEHIRKLASPRLVALESSADGSRGALIIGPTGAGKSIIAALIARKRMRFEAEQNYERVNTELHKASEWQSGTETYLFGVSWKSASQLSRARRAHPLGKGEAPELERAFDAKLLVIDDLGWEPSQDPVCADVLSERYDRGLPTIVTSGLTEGELTGRYGAALVRRITETSGRDGLMVDLFTGNEQSKR